jgi:hypothetical protein
MPYLIQEPNGDQCIVLSLDGHDGCTVLDADASEPSPVSEAAQINGMSRQELFDLAVATARQRVVDDMLAAGAITAAAALKMRAAAN